MRYDFVRKHVSNLVPCSRQNFGHGRWTSLRFVTWSYTIGNCSAKMMRVADGVLTDGSTSTDWRTFEKAIGIGTVLGLGTEYISYRGLTQH